MHLMKHHTLDLLIMEGFIVLFWFNPAVWLLKKELQEVHEYEADHGVLNQGIDATKYQLLLVKKAAGARLYSIANSFNHSKLKNRITMMLKEKSSQWARLKVLLFILPTAVLMLAFARPENALLEAGNVSEFKVIQISEENQSDPEIVMKKVKVASAQKDSLVVIAYRGKVSKSDSSVIVRDVVIQADRAGSIQADSSRRVFFTMAREKGYKVSCRGITPPSPLIVLTYLHEPGTVVSLASLSEDEFVNKLEISDFAKDKEITLQVNRQRNDELQNRIIELLKGKGVKGEIKLKKGAPAPPLAPLQMAFVYNSGQIMLKDVWQVSNAENFIDHTPVNRVKEVTLTITPKCKDEMKKAIRDYLTQKGFTQISEKQLDYD